MADDKVVKEHISAVRKLLNELEEFIGMDAGGPVNPPTTNEHVPVAASSAPATGDDIDPAALPKSDPAETVEGFHAEPPTDDPESSNDPVTTSITIPPSNITGA